MANPTLIARLKIELADVKPPVMRRIELPLAWKLDRLHQVLQAVMGWEDYHLHEFRFKGVRYGIPDPDWDDDELHDDAKITLGDALALSGGKSFSYIYDFGDNWEHKIKVERIGPVENDARYPRMIDATGACPPEDSGGPFGYMDKCEILADPNHHDHAEIAAWMGGGFDPNAVNVVQLRLNLEPLVRRWNRKARQ